MDHQDDMQKSLDNHKTIEEMNAEIIIKMRKDLEIATRANIIHTTACQTLLLGLNDLISSATAAMGGEEGRAGLVEAAFIRDRAKKAIAAYYQTIANLS
jgi:hypothetical protein